MRLFCLGDRDICLFSMSLPRPREGQTSDPRLGVSMRHLKIVYVDPKTLKHFPGNPRIMPDDQKTALNRGINHFGYVEPLVVRQGNEVVGGNQRLDEALASKRREVPIVRIRVNDKDAKALNIALNKVHGEWDEEKLAEMLKEIAEDPVAELTGFNEAEIDKIIADAQIPNLSGSGIRGESQGLSLVPYLGGKQRLVPQLANMLPPHVAYIEVFGGGAALLLNKPPSDVEVYNDLDGELVNLFETIRDDVDAFVKRADLLLYSRELFEKWSADLTAGSAPKDRVERALRFWYVQRSAFGGHVGWGYARGEKRCLAETIRNALGDLQAIHERLLRVEVDHLDFRRLLANRDHESAFFFLDPPYLETTGYRVGTFTLDDHKALAELLSKAQGKWLMTVGDHPEMRSLYLDQLKGSLDSSLSVQQVIGGERETYKNLIVSNYRLPQQLLDVTESSS